MATHLKEKSCLRLASHSGESHHHQQSCGGKTFFPLAVVVVKVIISAQVCSGKVTKTVASGHQSLQQPRLAVVDGVSLCVFAHLNLMLCCV